MREITEPVPETDAPRRGKYDWPKWADGKWREAEAGVDFTNAGTFRQLVGQWANNRYARIKDQGRTFRAQTKTTPEGNVRFRIIPGPEATPAQREAHGLSPVMRQAGEIVEAERVHRVVNLQERTDHREGFPFISGADHFVRVTDLPDAGVDDHLGRDVESGFTGNGYDAVVTD